MNGSCEKSCSYGVSKIGKKNHHATDKENLPRSSLDLPLHRAICARECFATDSSLSSLFEPVSRHRKEKDINSFNWPFPFTENGSVI